MYLSYVQLGGLMALAPVLVALVLLIPTAIKLAASFYKGLAVAAFQFAFKRRGEQLAA